MKRLRNELKECRKTFRHKFIIKDKSFKKFPVEIMVTLVDCPGPIWNDGKISTKYEHKLKIIITEEYPFQTPIVRWKSSIFHPNIMPPEDGGYICTKLIDGWTFHSNLVAFIEGIEILLANPNPDSPFETDTCTRAAEYFNKNGYSPPEINRRKPIILEENDKNR